LGVDHLKAHLYAPFIDYPVAYPFAGLVVSGGHTTLYRVSRFGREEVMGATRDDAAGEAFDKVAKILGLGYPGGPVIEKAALRGNREAFAFRCDCGDGLDFSFSGIKTAVLYKVRELTRGRGSRPLAPQTVADLCASFQESVVADLVQKSLRAARLARARLLAVGGGVAFNEYLRRRLQETAARDGVRLCVAARPYCLDNAAMVASLGARLSGSGKRPASRLNPVLG
jgi:N6-L-threonylcarbamoyladenine synthase